MMKLLWFVCCVLTYAFTRLALAQEAENATFPCSADSEVFHCGNGICTQLANFCDNITDCPNGADELLYSKAVNQSAGIACKLDQGDVEHHCFLPLTYQCKSSAVCQNGVDVCGCPDTFKCDGVGCTIKAYFCDENPNCEDGSDEMIFNRTTKLGFQCPVTKTHYTNKCVLPDRYVCDGDSDCDYGIDECFCNFTEGSKKGIYNKNVYSNDKCFRCLDGSLIIPNIHVCDGVVHCEDLSDECFCQNKKHYKRLDVCESVCKDGSCDCPGKLQCVPNQRRNSTENQKMCLDSTSICDNMYDCENHMDENACPRLNQSFGCFNDMQNIRRDKLCDGPRDCGDGSDELNCFELTNYICYTYRHFFMNIAKTVTDWNNVTKEQISIPGGRKLHADQPLYTHACDGIPHCEHADDECYANCTGGAPEYCRYVKGFGKLFSCKSRDLTLVGREICDGTPTCDSVHPEKSEDEIYCPNRFYCANKGATRLPIHLPTSSYCNEITECDDASDEMNCSSATHFYCNDGGSKLFVSRSQVCNGRQDCESGVDECQNCNPSPFSSDEKLISSRFLHALLWIIGTLSVFGNLLVVIIEVKNLLQKRGNPSKIVISNWILVLNLALADLLVGIYLLALGIKDATIDKYCLLDQEWRSSSTCSALGVIAVIGTETSVFILMIMTAYRLYLVVNPMNPHKLGLIGIALSFSWIFSTVLAFIPLAAKDYFVSCVWYKTHHFIGRICKNDLASFISRVILFEGNNKTFSSSVKNGYTWDSMFAAMAKFNASYVPERYFGYYSAHSVCLPRLFPDPKQDISWGYSFFIIFLNFFAFVFIFITYVIIYRSATKTAHISAASTEERSTLLQRKISRILLSDFCCWMPICIMAFVKASGVSISDYSYAITAIILLPINSAMNPLLYSDMLDVIWDKMKPVRKRFNQTGLGKGIQKRRSASRQAAIEGSSASASNMRNTSSAALSPIHQKAVSSSSQMETKM